MAKEKNIDNEPENMLPGAGQRITIDVDDKYDDYYAAEQAVWAELEECRRRKTRIRGQITGYEPSSQRGYDILVEYKNQIILVPLQEMALDDVIEEGGINRVAMVLESMQGSEISIIVKGVDIKNHVAVGSRKEAMLSLIEQFYESHGKFAPRIQQGSEVEATVICVFRNSIRIDVSGIEKRIYKRDAQIFNVVELDELYYPGQRILVRMKRIEKQDNGKFDIDIEICNRNAEKKPSLVEGAKYTGVVTGYSNNTWWIRLNPDKGGRINNAVCNRTLRGIYPKVGDTVSCEFKGFTKRGEALVLIREIKKAQSKLWF